VRVADRRRGERAAARPALPPAGARSSRAPVGEPPARARPPPRGAGRAAPRRAAGDSAITRTVVQVLEVIPLRLRIASRRSRRSASCSAAAALVQARRVRRLERQRGRLAADVGVLQSALLPELPARIGGARVTAAYRPAEGLAGGGDFFDGFELPDGRTAILVGDVAGHGREVVPTTALVRYSLRAYLEAGLEPRAALAVASDVLGAQLDGRLVTGRGGHLRPRGRPADVRVRRPLAAEPARGADVPVLVCSSPARRGRADGPPADDARAAARRAACLHTDGLADVLVGTERLGMDGVAAELAAVGPQATRASCSIGRRLSDRQPDDMAVCLLTALPGGGSGDGPRVEVLEADPAMLGGPRVERFLTACGVDGPGAAAALADARELAARAGTAILEVRSSVAHADVRVLAPAPPALSLGPSAGRAGARGGGLTRRRAQVGERQEPEPELEPEPEPSRSRPGRSRPRPSRPGQSRPPCAGARSRGRGGCR
jgi:hypothetical protein